MRKRLRAYFHIFDHNFAVLANCEPSFQFLRDWIERTVGQITRVIGPCVSDFNNFLITLVIYGALSTPYNLHIMYSNSNYLFHWRYISTLGINALKCSVLWRQRAGWKSLIPHTVNPPSDSWQSTLCGRASPKGRPCWRERRQKKVRYAP